MPAAKRTRSINGQKQSHTTHIGIKPAAQMAKTKARYTAPMAVNGDFAPDTPVIRDLKRHIADHRGPEDLSATARINWDRKGLLVEFTVTDDVHVQPHPAPGEVWRGDCIQMVVGIFYPEQGRHVFRNIFLTQVHDEPHPFILEDPDHSDLVRLTVRREGTRTVYRALLDRTLFPDELKSGARIPFGFTVNETDDKSGFRGWLEWTPGICGSRNYDALGEITLK